MFRTVSAKFSVPQNITTLPDKLEYAIRFPGELRNNFNNPNPVIFTWRTDFRFPFFQIGGARNFDYADGGAPPGYYAERFIHLQHVLFNAYVGMRNASNERVRFQPLDS
jgi:ATP-binding cassette, subfamily A (ABC1), member 3